MARTLYLPDGSMELVFGDPEGTLQKIIYERLGRDCEELYTEILADLREELTGGDDYEKVADGYRGMAVDTMNDLHEVLVQPRLNRKRLEAIYENLNKNL